MYEYNPSENSFPILTLYCVKCPSSPIAELSENALSLGKPNNRFTVAKIHIFNELTKFIFITFCMCDVKRLNFSCFLMLVILITSMFYTPITKNRWFFPQKNHFV